MPLTKIDFDGHTYTKDELLEHLSTRRDESMVTYEVAAAMLDAVQDRGSRISTTTLTAKCLRSETLKRSLPYTEDLQRLWASFRGTMFHGQLEKYAHLDAVAEARYWAKVEVDVDPDGAGILRRYDLSGSPDLVDVERGILYDYKFTKQNPMYDRPWPDHVEQLQINRWLVDHAYKVELRDSVTLTKVPRPQEWQDLVVVYMDDKGIKPLRVTKSIQISKVDGKGTKAARVSDIWDDEKVEELIRTRYAAAYDALNGGAVPSIPSGWEHQSHALCAYCPMRMECADLEARGK